mgnify:CR=1 FL=1
MKITRRTAIAAVAALGVTAMPAFAQYPTKPITAIVPFAAGGPTDVVTRLVTEHMSRTLGQQIIVENIGGAGGTIGMSRAAAGWIGGRGSAGWRQMATAG